ncbi:hypothetical protein [Ktedonobacter racemifer]|uniref:Uncharacterized protein n=1 Tax=Ktedonobacter racemifer DSM 44963 TaxID=485913 RepID=D6TGZ5_KTERA|nr:hypothetical protein [Ktedonobacter racemifer]EFH88924.1 hypothetical protein Krac_10437 [Ktedonobacter racemifer DSM 44963]
MPTVDTITLLIARPTDFAQLEAQFQLIRYVLPETLGAKTSQRGRGNAVYARLHTSLRGQLNYPYRTYSFDKLDGSEKWVVYALLPHGETAPVLRLNFAHDAVVQPQRIAFEQLEFHVLLKLLQIAYFRGVQPGYFVGMDDCYIFASRSKKLVQDYETFSGRDKCGSYAHP